MPRSRSPKAERTGTGPAPQHRMPDSPTNIFPPGDEVHEQAHSKAAQQAAQRGQHNYEGYFSDCSSHQILMNSN